MSEIPLENIDLAGELKGAKILILLPGNKLFGQERALLNLGLTLRHLGIDVTYLLHGTWGTPLLSNVIEELGFSWKPLPLGTIWSVRLLLQNPLLLVNNILSIFKVHRQLKLICKGGNYSAIILGNITFAFYLISSLRTLPIMRIFRHGDAPTDSNVIQRWISRRVLKSADYHVANCKYLENQIKSFDATLSPRVIYNCPVQFYIGSNISEKAESPYPRTSNVLLFVGQMTKHKGADICLKAFDHLADEYPNLSLHMVGSASGIGDQASELDYVAFMQKKWGSRVRHTPFLTDLSDVYCGSLIHLCPSTWDDPSPNVILEAKFHGTPTVGFERGGISELIAHKEDGYVCDAPTVDGLMEGIRYFLDSPQALLSASLVAKRNMDRRFSYTVFRESWKDVLTQLLSSNK